MEFFRKKPLLLLLGLSAILTVCIAKRKPNTPEQIHISYTGSNPTQMTVTWLTFNTTKFSVVQYGWQVLNEQTFGGVTKFVDGGNESSVRYIHRAVLSDLKPGVKYFYRCGSELAWSNVNTFRAMKNGTNWSPRFAFFGDMGIENARSLPRLLKDVQAEMYDAIFHIGDFAYDMADDNARVGDQFMNMIQPIASKVPYMTCVGNHEFHYDYSNYKNRLGNSMPNTPGRDNMYYSFDVGPVHFIAINTEIYYYKISDLKQIYSQHKWVENDLIEATKPQNRAVRPWIIMLGHRPMYCGNRDNDMCTKNENLVRNGYWGVFGLEKLLYSYGVDLAIWAHEHSYERLWPIYDFKVYNGTPTAYTNPKAPVHITTGSAGCKEKLDPFKKTPPAWSAVRLDDYGYTRLQIHNSTHIFLQQVSDDKGGKIVDAMTLIREKHGPYSEL
ncbi:acid phosphatase type 7-like [Tubulanus polymorphus]|uniref:acid phosphatase type 7-like n=1 Tax=Tubulanus polymorphus TaxID=672921 RepID=UPI003DA22AB4